jgi:hypothetical protein
VAPEDASFHLQICSFVHPPLIEGGSVQHFKELVVDLSCLPVLRERVKLAKQVPIYISPVKTVEYIRE